MTNEQLKKKLLKANELNQKSTAIMSEVFDYLYSVGIDPTETPSKSYNADTLADAITCFVAYDEWEIEDLMEEIKNAIERNEE